MPPAPKPAIESSFATRFYRAILVNEAIKDAPAIESEAHEASYLSITENNERISVGFNYRWGDAN